MEWVHCHIARQADAPGERARGIPDAISSIVMKLLAMTAEERYQTAAGVEVDLRRCLSEWQSHGRIDPFSLGAQDVPDRLLIAEQLYGRKSEITTLLTSFDRVVTQGTPELVLVSGYSGVGKSAVVNELHKGVAFVVDLTERQRAEAELVHANRVATMGQLSASIAHEVNQPIAAALVNAETAVRWLARQPPDLEKTRQSIDRIINDGKRAADIVSRIRDFSKKAPARKEDLEINDAILEIMGLTRVATAEHGISVKMQPDHERY
jgi:signal transduction histidine kinase